MRYFLELAYNGTRFHGWQRQPTKKNTVQEVIENALSALLRSTTAVVGCGRTDTGVHAEQYFLHFDTESPLPENLLYKLNRLVGKDIVFYRLFESALHARFDAISRSYKYSILTERNPFRIETALYLHNSAKVQQDLMQEVAKLLLQYEDFDCFCKSDTDVRTKKCTLTRAEWIFEEHEWTFHISANRFLRGMIRLIVGECLNIGLGTASIQDLEYALNNRVLLKKPNSVAPHGLFLTDIKY